MKKPEGKRKEPGVLELLRRAFSELAKNPVLFAPKFVSVTVYAFIYSYMISEMRAVLAAQALTSGYFIGMGALFAFLPIWLIIDSMYPSLVEQLLRKERLDFKSALSRSASKFLGVLALVLLFMVVSLICAAPFLLVAVEGMRIGSIALIAIGALGAGLVLFALSVAGYFLPTSILIERKGLVDSLKEGFGATRKNLKLVTILSLVSFVVLIAGFALEGTFESAGIIGFFLARYAGGILTVYLYVVNPTAYVETEKR